MIWSRRHLRSIDVLGEGPAAQAGPEALRLARAHRAGVTVPPTLVVLASAYREAVRLAGLDVWIEGLWEGPWDWRRRRAMLEHLRAALRGHPAVVAFSESVVAAVRRHGLVEGIGDAHLAILPSPTVPCGREEGLLRLHDQVWDVGPEGWAKALRQVWASLWNDRAFLHRRERHLVARPAQMAVLFRVWLPARRWGILRHGEEGLRCEVHHRPGPVGAAEDVSTLHIDEAADEMRWSGAPGRPGLDAEELHTLLRLDSELEKIFTTPQDFVWIWERGKPCLLSCADAPPGTEGFEWEWSRAHLRELLPELPSYFTTDHLLRHLPAGLEAVFHMAGGGACPTTMPAMRAFAGRPYMNLQWQRLLAHRLGCREETWDGCFGGRRHGGAGESLLPEKAALGMMDGIRLVRELRRSERLFAWHAAGVGRLVDRAGAMDFSAMPLLDLMLWREQELRIVEAENVMVMGHAMAGLTLGLTALHGLLDRLGEDGAAWLARLVPRPDVGVDLRACFDVEGLVARSHPGGLDEEAFRAFLHGHGHRGFHEEDEASPRFADDPEILRRLLENRLAAGPPCDLRARFEKRLRADGRAMETLGALVAKRWGRAAAVVVMAGLRWILRRVHLHLRLRGATRRRKLELMVLRRRFHGALARRWITEGVLDREDDMPFLGEGEIARACAEKGFRSALRAIVAKRRRMGPELLAQAVPHRFVGRVPPPAEDDEGRAMPRLLRGLPVAPGLAAGTARFCAVPEDLARLAEGEILVTEQLDPSWVPFLALAAAVVTRRGGWLSHGFVVLREMGTPVVSGLDELDPRGVEGRPLRVDGGAGTVEIVG